MNDIIKVVVIIAITLFFLIDGIVTRAAAMGALL